MPQKKLDTGALVNALTQTVLDHTATLRADPDIGELTTLFIKAARAALKQRQSVQSDVSLEHMPFTEFYDLTIPIPQKGTNHTVDYPLLSDYFRNEPFFKEYPTIAAVRDFLEKHDANIDQMTGIRYDRRAELAQLVYRCGLEPLPGMPEWIPEESKLAVEHDHKYLRRIMDLTMSPQSRSAITSYLSHELNDPQYYTRLPISRMLIRAHLIAGRKDNILCELHDLRNFNTQATAHVVFLMFFQEIGLNSNGKPIMKPRKPTNDPAFPVIIDSDLKT